MNSMIRILFLFLTIDQSQAADPFLQKQEKRNLIDGLKLVLGPGSLKNVDKLSARIKPMFDSLPKQSSNHLGHATARYVLHRIILDVHGWSVAGLEVNETTKNLTSLAVSGILSELLPPHIEQLFAEHTDTFGFSLEHTAILAATIEHLVREDQKDILRKACEVLDLPTIGLMSDSSMKTIIQVYMASFLQSLDPGRLNEKMANKLLKMMPRVYPGWNDVTVLIDDAHEALVYNDRMSSNPFQPRDHSLDVALAVVGHVADHYVHKHAEPECQEIKENLLEFERGETGRIRLVDFYRSGLNSRFFYTESKEYLRALGALDETDSLVGPKVIVPNYVLAKSNCLAHAHIYSICCINECEGLYGEIEQIIAAPSAKPQQIASLVAKLSSSTVQAPRNLSQMLLSRLGEIAGDKNGNIFLHSRLFAQFMHHAFPRECPYPHLVGSTTQQSSTKWAAENKVQASIHTSLPMSQHRNATLKHIETLERSLSSDLGVDAATQDTADMMWSLEDETYVQPTILWSPSWGRLAFLVPGALVGVAIWAKISVKSGSPACSSQLTSAHRPHFV